MNRPTPPSPLAVSLLPLLFALGACSASLPEERSESPLVAKPANAAPGKSAPGVTANCDAWSTAVVGPYKFENNVWGSKKSQAPFEQCLLTRQGARGTEHGWTWNWPGFDRTVFAYPQILFGWKPWSGGKPTDARFPLRVADARHVALHYEVETQAEGSYNLAPEIWLMEGGESSTKADPRRITAEVMFWMDYKAGARPAGEIISTPTLDGVTYELWKADEIGDKGDGKGWLLLSFKSPTTQHTGTVSIHKMLEHLVEAKLVDANHYVASVEFGNEVMGGSGTTWVKRFEVDVR
jgi:hypothetical protein